MKQKYLDAIKEYIDIDASKLPEADLIKLCKFIVTAVSLDLPSTAKALADKLKLPRS